VDEPKKEEEKQRPPLKEKTQKKAFVVPIQESKGKPTPVRGNKIGIISGEKAGGVPHA